VSALPDASASVRLVPLAEAHLDDVAALLDDPDVLRFTRLPVPPPPDYARHWLTRYEAGRRDGTREAFAAVDDRGRFLGLALAVDIDREAREVELGYIVAPDARGRGVATGMLEALTRWAFAAAEALRIYLIIDVENGASSRVAERCGYVREGVMRSTHLKDDVRIDAAVWSRLPSDP
jgi:RimJ/RimL family protein N-acetyltransferase